MAIDWSKVKPATSSTVLTEVPEGSERVPNAVLGLYKNTRGLGKTIKRQTDGTMVIRKIQGVVYAVPASAVQR